MSGLRSLPAKTCLTKHCGHMKLAVADLSTRCPQVEMLRPAVLNHLEVINAHSYHSHGRIAGSDY